MRPQLPKVTQRVQPRKHNISSQQCTVCGGHSSCTSDLALMGLSASPSSGPAAIVEVHDAATTPMFVEQLELQVNMLGQGGEAASDHDRSEE